MKTIPITALVILALALVVWTTFYIQKGGEPPTQGETSVVVAVCAAVVLFWKWIWARLRKRGVK